MSKFDYARFKVRIAPDSEKRQGLRTGDVVRRQYADGSSVYYSLMVVVETGEDLAELGEGKRGVSPYFIGALIDGNAPRDGELLDFMRLTSLLDERRSGAMYLTASDEESPYLDVTDGMGTAGSLCYPTSLREYVCSGGAGLDCSYIPQEGGVSRIVRMRRTATVAEGMVGLAIPITAPVVYAQCLIISYRIRASKVLKDVSLCFGYADGRETDGSDVMEVTTEWQYRLTMIGVDFPGKYERTLRFDLTQQLLSGDWCEVGDLNVCLLEHLTSFEGAVKARMGRVTGIADPLFGLLQGYGAYFQRLYATRDVNIAGTLSAGDGAGFGSTFYVGRIHKNCFINSLEPVFMPKAVTVEDSSPTGMGKCYRIEGDEVRIVCQHGGWTGSHAGERYCFSFWMRSETDRVVKVEYGTALSADICAGQTWERHVVVVSVEPTEDEMCVVLKGAEGCLFSSAQLESGESASLYQATDNMLTEGTEYGAWFCRGGVGGTMQHPLLRLEADGTIRAGNDSFVISPDGSGYFSKGAFRWDDKAVMLSERVLLKWENLDAETRQNLTGQDAYTVYSSVPGCVFQASYTGEITTEQRIELRIYAYKGRVQMKPMLGVLPTVSGMEIVSGPAEESVVITVHKDTCDLADSGNLEIPVTVEDLVFYVPFTWSKARAGLPGDDFAGMDWLFEWNSNLTQIGSSTLVSGKIFAGVKHADDTVTGVAIGDFDVNMREPDGSVVSTHVGGISAFVEGVRTFYVDQSGNAGLGKGDEYVRYNASEGKIEFGPGVSLSWTDAIGEAKRETLAAAAITAQGKADAALESAESYSDKKKNEAITEAGQDTDRKLEALNVCIADAKKAGTDAQAVADAIVLQATREGWPTKLTYIDRDGIFTGRLSANVVKALQVDASQVVSGVIDTARLDAASIQANIINAGYINGLSCAFVRGTIGGWTIGPTSLSNDHVLLDSGNKRVVVHDSRSGAVNGRRVQLYYNNDTDFGFYSTDVNGVCVARLGSLNQIAGWTIDATQLYKNSVYLGADGSITNGSKWRLNNDGSGCIAGGNISWDASGKVVFSSSVSVQWKNDIEAAKSANYGYRYHKDLIIYGDSDKYYPVVVKGGDQSIKRDLFVRRNYNELAPADWDNQSVTHMGGLSLLIKTNFGGWGGATYSWDIYELSEFNSRMFGGASLCGNDCMFAVFLRGGGSTGALYHLYSDQPLDSSLYSPSPIPPSPQIAYHSDQIFLSGAHKAYAPAPRTLTAAVEEEIRSHRFIVLTQNNASTLIQHPLTYINGTGIYTGTLTAAQVNAVAINAGSITTGTLSADRIAAGSINSTKLDAASIKANIINTNYINGLSCTFAHGSIGGWRIGADNITVGNVGALGTMPIQIRSAGSGSGYWYSGAYKPYGITMTWFQNNNAGHFIFGQIAASGNSVKSGFLGIQMMSWDGMEYFCLSANYTRSGSKEVYNRIAGWAFDQSRIYKNNVSLGADGSITNASKWQLNNDGSASFGSGKITFRTDGSGYVANNKFSWDSTGNIVAQGCSFKDVTIQGTIRSAFVKNDPSIWITIGDGTPSGVQTDPVHYDNVVCLQSGGWSENINLPWTLENSGRRICLVNYKWGSTITTGVMKISAPSGKYFFEDGIGKSTLSFSREVIELLGYGDNVNFFGWIVLNRRDIMTASKYGEYGKILATGVVQSTKTTAIIGYHTFDGTKSLSVTRLARGKYRIYFPSSWNLQGRYIVMATGVYSTAEDTPIYPTLKAMFSNYFDVYTQDDSSYNDGAFNFQMISTADWDRSEW